MPLDQCAGPLAQPDRGPASHVGSQGPSEPQGLKVGSFGGVFLVVKVHLYHVMWYPGLHTTRVSQSADVLSGHLNLTYSHSER